MKAARRMSDEARPSERARVAGPLDSGETRAIMIGAVVLAIFLYFIKLILLPFVLAGIVAYICTPILDWAAKRTGWPRLLFAVALFLVLCGVSVFVGVIAAERLADEARATAADLQVLLENFTRQAMGEQSITVFGYSMNAREIAQAVLERVRDWAGQTDQVAVLAGYSLAAAMGAFLTIVLLFYFLVSGRQVAHGIFWIVPPHRRPLAARIWARLDPVLMHYFIGVIGVMIYATVGRLHRPRRYSRHQTRRTPGAADRHSRNRSDGRANGGGSSRRPGFAADGKRHYQHHRVCRLCDRLASFD